MLYLFHWWHIMCISIWKHLKPASTENWSRGVRNPTTMSIYNLQLHDWQTEHSCIHDKMLVLVYLIKSHSSTDNKHQTLRNQTKKTKSSLITVRNIATFRFSVENSFFAKPNCKLNRFILCKPHTPRVQYSLASVAYPVSLTIKRDPRRISLITVMPSSPASRALWSSNLHEINIQGGPKNRTKLMTP